MKKFLALALCLVLAFSLAACGGSPAASQPNQPGSSVTGGEVAADWAEYDALIKEIYAATDTAEREKLMHQAEDMLMSTYAVVPLYYYNDVYMQNSNVTGVYATVYGMKYFMYAEKKDGDTTLKLNLASEPDYLDPALNSSVDGGCLALNSFEGLYTFNAKGELVPALAAAAPEVSEDGKTYVFTLKDDLKWSDGSALTAEDFVYAWNRACAEETAADYGYMFDIIARKDDGKLDVAADGNTLTINLTGPCSYFLDLVAFPTYLPVQKACVEASADASAPGKWAQEAGFVSNGAYTLKSWTHEESMVYVKNPNYWNADNVKIERLEFMLSDDEPAIFAAYNSGDLDFTDSVPTDEIASLKGVNDEFYIIPQLGTYFITFNVNSDLFAGKTPEQAAAMRQAFSLLIDREYICENIGQTGQVPANTFVPPAMRDGNGGEFRVNDGDYTYPDKDSVGYYDPAYKDENIDRAIELLEFAGYEFDENGMLSANTPISFEYLTNTTTGHVKIAEAFQQDMAQIGIEVTVKQEDWNVFLEDRKNGNFGVARDGWLADFDDPINMLEMWTSTSGNNNAQFGR